MLPRLTVKYADDSVEHNQIKSGICFAFRAKGIVMINGASCAMIATIINAIDHFCIFYKNFNIKSKKLLSQFDYHRLYLFLIQRHGTGGHGLKA